MRNEAASNLRRRAREARLGEGARKEEEKEALTQGFMVRSSSLRLSQL